MRIIENDITYKRSVIKIKHDSKKNVHTLRRSEQRTSTLGKSIVKVTRNDRSTYPCSRCHS